MEKLTEAQIKELNLVQAQSKIMDLQKEISRLEYDLNNEKKHSISDGAKIDAVKEILNNLWCC